MSMFYEKKQNDYPDIGQNNSDSNPYAAKSIHPSTQTNQSKATI